MHPSTVSTYVTQLLDQRFIQKGKNKRTPRLKLGQKPADTYYFEDLNFVSNQERGFQYQFAPGSVQYSEQFLEMYRSIVNRTSEDRILRLLVQFLEEIFIEASHHKISLLPQTKKDFRCPGCGVNHEIRDFIRAILVHLIDQLEISGVFIKFLNNKNALNEELYQRLEKKAREIKTQDSRKRGESGIILRMLSVNKRQDEESILILAIDKDCRFIYGQVYCDLIDAIGVDTIIECSPSLLDRNRDGTFYIRIHEEDPIRILSEDPSFPGQSKIQSKIDTIKGIQDLMGFSPFYCIRAIIVRPPDKIERRILGRVMNGIDTIVADDTGEIRMVSHYDNPDDLHVGDLIDVIGTGVIPHWEGYSYDPEYEITNTELRMSPYGSIIKREKK
jgi:hypothetical protein